MVISAENQQWRSGQWDSGPFPDSLFFLFPAANLMSGLAILDSPDQNSSTLSANVFKWVPSRSFRVNPIVHFLLADCTHGCGSVLCRVLRKASHVYSTPSAEHCRSSGETQQGAFYITSAAVSSRAVQASEEDEYICATPFEVFALPSALSSTSSTTLQQGDGGHYFDGWFGTPEIMGLLADPKLNIW